MGRPGTTAYLHGRLTAAALWCQAESHSPAVSCPSSTAMKDWLRADDHLNGWSVVGPIKLDTGASGADVHVVAFLWNSVNRIVATCRYGIKFIILKAP